MLSIYGSDVIIYGPNLRSYLMTQFGFIDHETAVRGADNSSPIPFWQDVIDCLEIE